MVHTRYSYSKDLETSRFSTEKAETDVCEENKPEGRTKIQQGTSLQDSMNHDSIRTLDEYGVHDRGKRVRTREIERHVYQNGDMNDSSFRRSLRSHGKRNATRGPNSPLKKQRRRSSYVFDSYESSLRRRSDRQPKKMFKSFNEKEIIRTIERKSQEENDMEGYESSKRKNAHETDSQEETEENGDDDESEEEKSEEEEAHPGYGLRKEKPKTNFFEVSNYRESRSNSRHHFGPSSPVIRKKRVKKLPQHSSVDFRAKVYQQNSSTPSSSDDEERFERRKRKSMSRARAKCLPMNFRMNDIAGVLNQRERANAGGSSLADIDPMTIDSKTSFADIGGLDEHISSLKEMVMFPLIYPEIFEKFKIAPPRGVIFHGPPGTGKTLVARALANECSTGNQKVAFFMRKGADCLSKWVGESERQLRLLFDQAYSMRPAIIFFDEIDGIAPIRSTRQDQIHSSIVSTLLALMDGLDSRGEIVVIGATNRLDAIDPALRRPGRFDREFSFQLPNKAAREKILHIHTASWSPKLSKEFISEVAEKCVGYCGADIKALCTEAALFALRRRYPQIYNSNKKLLLDINQIKLSVVDFKNAIQRILPAAARTKSNPGKPLSEEVVSLLSVYVDKSKDILRKVFPHSVVKDTSEATCSTNQDNNVNIFQNLSKRKSGGRKSYFESTDGKLAGQLYFRPRLLIHGKKGNGQTAHIGPALLHWMEGLPTHVLDFPFLYSNSMNSAEEKLLQLFHEAVKSTPSIIYIPHLDVLWENFSDVMMATFVTQLENLPSRAAVLLLATSECHANALPNQLQLIFAKQKELVAVEQLSESARRSYFEQIIIDHALNSVEEVSTREENSVEREYLPEAPAQPKRKLSPEENNRLIESEESTLRELRLFLRQITWKLLRDRKFKEFSKPVDVDEVDDYLKVVEQPMDLSTVMSRINSHHYQSCRHYLEDIDLIVNNCLEYNPDRDQFDKLLRNRACELRDVAHSLVYTDLDPEFDKLCLEIHDSRQKRGYDKSKTVPSFMTVMPKYHSEEHANRPSFTAPSGSRFSLRVRGIPLYDTCEVTIENCDKGACNAVPTENLLATQKSQSDVANNSEGNTVAQVDEVNIDDGNIDEQQPDIMVHEEKQGEDSLRHEGLQLLSHLVDQTSSSNVEDLEHIYCQICYILQQNKHERNRFSVLNMLREMIDNY